MKNKFFLIGSEDNIDKPVIVQTVNNLLIIEIIKDIVTGNPAFWSIIVEAASFAPIPPGKPDNMPAIPEIK